MLPLERQVDILARLTERARTYFDLFKFIEGAEYRPKIIDQMNEYIWFFRMQGHVLRYTLIVELGALFENGNTAVCFHSVLKRAESQLPYTVHTRLVDMLNTTDAVAKKVSKLRNKAFAHRDTLLDFDDVFREAAITLDEIEGLIENSKSLADCLCEEFGIQKVQFVTAETVDDCERLFKKLGSDI